MSRVRAAKKNAMIRARTTARLKGEAERIFMRLGLSSTDAINLFYVQVCLRKGLPFPVEIPNEETLRTFRKTDRGQELVHARNEDELFARLGI